MTRRGVVVSINSDSAEEATHLNQEAAKSMKFGGLSHDEALKMVTLNPAMQLGIDKRVGTIDVGKDATWRFIITIPQRLRRRAESHNRWPRLLRPSARHRRTVRARKRKKGAHRQTEKISGEETGRQETGRQKTRRCRARRAKTAEKKPEVKKPEEKKPEEKPKPPQSSEVGATAADVRSGGAL